MALNFDIYDLFNFLKNEEYDKFEKSIDHIINNNLSLDDIDLNVKDDDNNYLLNYIILANKHQILEKMFKIENIKIDIFDSDNKNILFIPIKYNYKKVFKLLLDYNKKTIGISICDLQDKDLKIPLHYAIILKNYDFIEDLLNNDSNTLFSDSNNYNSLHMLY